MHGRFWMNTWSKEINLDDYAECKEFRIHYYTRRMNGGYNSHLFLVNWDSEEQLLKGWNQIDSFVAVNIQSQTELLIERSNFYIIHFVKKTVMKEIKRGMKNGIQLPCDKDYAPQAPSCRRDEAGLCEILHRPHVRHGLHRGRGLARCPHRPLRPL